MCISFISSRRRHTRCGRDWSSDVCSSDLKDWGVNNIRAVEADVFKVIKKIDQSFDIIFADPPYNNPQYPELPDMRSEERRVGKECRSWWSTDGEKYKTMCTMLKR